MPSVHIHSPPPTEVVRRIFWCRQCKHMRVHAVLCFEWYEPDAICATCGRDPTRMFVRKTVNAAARHRARKMILKNGDGR